MEQRALTELECKDVVTRLMLTLQNRQAVLRELQVYHRLGDVDNDSAERMYELLETFPHGVIANERNNVQT